MTTRAPDSLETFWTYVHGKIPSAQLGGIVGDAKHRAEQHTYHISRQDQGNGGYSTESYRNQGGPSDLAAAFDLTLSPELMVTVTRRLHVAALNRDPRLANLAEFCGTLDNRNTYPWDMRSNTSEGVGSWDDSHLWHVHLSFYRDTVNSWAAIQPIADVICGVPAKPGPYPLLGLRRFRNGDSGHGVMVIQHQLAALGYAVAADGDYGPKTIAAVNDWKKRIHFRPDGKVGRIAWRRLLNPKAATDRKVK
jgi:hypothetical protein